MTRHAGDTLHTTLRRVICLTVSVFLLAAGTTRASEYYSVVAQDGSGDYATVQAAIDAVPVHAPGRTRIYIKAGTYREKITLPATKPRLTLVGENRTTTILTYGDHASINANGTVNGTAESASFYIYAKKFGARNLTFANSAGDAGPAIAAYVQGNRAHFSNCAFVGYQDTLFTCGNVGYFSDCLIMGALDFIFGNSAAVFDHCAIDCVGNGYITAASTPQGQNDGYVFTNCTITGTAKARAVYLGRPWGDYANVVFIDCAMDDVIAPAGWYDWGDPSTHDTVLYAEYRSTGAGADPEDRVDWSQQLTDAESEDYTPAKVFGLPTLYAAVDIDTLLPLPWYENY